LAAELAAQPLLIELPAVVKSAGLRVSDHAAVIAALSELQLEGVPQRAVDKRRAEFLAGRFAALQALRELGEHAAPGRHDDGSPRWPSSIVGSITHGAERALCAVARSADVRGLGIDAERVMGEGVSVELRRRICTSAELALLAEQIELPEHELVSLAFSAKESLYKCLYPLVGRFMDLSAARVVGGVLSGQSSAGRYGELQLELSVDWSEDFRAGRRLGAKFLRGSEHVETAVLLLCA
jgi:enterobactin synthetase component D